MTDKSPTDTDEQPGVSGPTVSASVDATDLHEALAEAMARLEEFEAAMERVDSASVTIHIGEVEFEHRQRTADDLARDSTSDDRF